MIGKYERSEAAPSIDAAKKIADALEVSLDHLVGEGLLKGVDKKNLQRLRDLEHLEEEKKKTLFYLIDTYIRDAKARLSVWNQYKECFIRLSRFICGYVFLCFAYAS
jgi:transcriptional regulator with XRE-family HTH domain